MKFSLISFLAAAGYAAAAKSNPFAPKVSANNAASAYTAKLVRGAKTVRALEGQNGQIDLTNYAIKFEKCQFVKEFAGGEEGGNNNNNGGNNFLQTKRFVIFRLCPNSSCGSCNSGFGEYITDLDTYLQATTEYVQQKQENMCQTCNQCYENQNNGGDGNDDNAYMCQNIDTSSCYEECQNIDNMEANGYIDASEFIECQQLQNNNNNNNNNGQQVNYYAGAICASSGTRIKIGVFTDNTCSTLAENMDVESMLNGDNGYMKLSYHKLKSVFPESDCVAKCLYEDANANNNGEQQQAQNAEICTNLYEAAGKCESTHGFSAMKYYNNNNNNQNNAQNTYYNQIRNEEAVCNYLQNVMSGIYDMSGEISIQGGRSVTGGGPATTGGQKFALTFFILGSAGLAGYALMLHQQLTKGAKANLANQGGAMA